MKPAPYSPPRHPAPIDLALASNEGRAPRDLPDLDALLPPAALARYPDATGLRDDLARRFGLAPQRVLVTAGGDDLLLRVTLAFLGPGREAVGTVPSFEMIPRHVALAGATLREVPWCEGPYPLEATLAAIGPRTGVVFLVTPNNPTGLAASGEDLARLADAARAVGARVLLDQAYVEFADEDLTGAALAEDGVIVLRTLSKAWGLAGLRVGYGLAGPQDVARLEAAGNPYALSCASLAIARARLVSGKADVADHVARVRSERAALRDRLEARGLRAAPSQANFVLARGDRAAWLRDALAGLGIGVRLFPDRADLADALRIGCPGDERSFERLLAALDQALAPQALLFDLDGVLADVSRSYHAAIRATAAAYGVELDGRAIAAAKAAGDANDDWALTARLMSERGVERPLAEVTACFEELYQHGLRQRETLLVPRATLAAWRGRLPLAVVTGRPRADAQRFLAERGVRDLFDALVCREDGPLKPDPAPVRIALERLGVARAWMLGDTPDDLAAARAAGVVPIGVLPPGAQPAAADTLLRAGAARVLTETPDLTEFLP